MISLGDKNNQHVELYFQCWELYQRKTRKEYAAPPRQSPKKWSADDVRDLVDARTQPNAPTFRNIAEELNRSYRRTGKPLDRPFTADDVRNKWKRLYPSSEDANRSIQFLRDLRKKWPGFVFRTVKESGRYGTSLSFLPGFTYLNPLSSLYLTMQVPIWTPHQPCKAYTWCSRGVRS